jgi:lysophospholipase L1-like esterase
MKGETYMSKQLKWYTFRRQTGVALLIVLFPAWYMLHGKYLHPAGRGPAGPDVPAQAFSHVWSNQKVVLVTFGDSITAGYGATKNHSYVDLLEKNDDAAHPQMSGRDLTHVFPKLDSEHNAISNTTSAEHVSDQIPYAHTYPKDTRGVIVITSGGNDLIHSYGRFTPKDGAMYGCTYEQALKWKENYRSRLKAIIQGAAKNFPGGCEIFVANVYDPTDGVSDIQNAFFSLPKWPDGVRSLELINKVIAESCAEYPNVHLVDIHKEFLGHGIHCRNRHNPYYRADDPYYWYFSNLEDPNDRGYDAIRRVFLIEMAKVFKPGHKWVGIKGK